ncbi:MAG: flagellar hook-length control protein FliK [Planctomycetota bacterium]
MQGLTPSATSTRNDGHTAHASRSVGADLAVDPEVFAQLLASIGVERRSNPVIDRATSQLYGGPPGANEGSAFDLASAKSASEPGIVMPRSNQQSEVHERPVTADRRDASSSPGGEPSKNEDRTARSRSESEASRGGEAASRSTPSTKGNHSGGDAVAPSTEPSQPAAAQGTQRAIATSASALGVVHAGVASGVGAATATSGGSNTGAPNGAVVGVGAAKGSNSQNVLKFQSPTPTPRSDGEAAVARVSKGLASLVQTKGGSLTLRLTPHALGDVRVHLRMGDGTVSARVEAETESARALLESGVDRLRSALEARGLKVDKVEVERWTHEPRRDSGGESAQERDGAGRDDRDPSSGRRPRGDAEHRAGGAGSGGESSPESGDGDQSGRRESGQAGKDPGAVTAEGGPQWAEPWTEVGEPVRHGSARPLTVRLDTMV